MLDRWTALRAGGKTAVQLSPEGRARIREAARRTMRLRHRKREALEWADWMLEQSRNAHIAMWFDKCQRVILEPYLTALNCGGMEELIELADLAGINLRGLQPGAELAQAILAKYAPRFDIRKAAEDLRRGARG
jgi:hypothetical protein